MNWFTRPKIGLALSGGGPKGIAHIGVIKVLEKHNIPIDYIAGTSAGSIAGAFYAFSKDIRLIEQYIIKKNWFELLSIFLDPSFRQGFVKGKRLHNFLKNYLGESTQFSDLKIPFSAISVNLNSTKLEKIISGPLIKAIIASCGAPLLFSPTITDSGILVDGGVISPVPVDEVRAMGANIVIAVDLYRLGYLKTQKMGPISIARRSLDIMLERLSRHSCEKADVVVRPKIENLDWGELLKTEERKQAIIKGEEAMEKAMPNLVTAINSKTLSYNIKKARDKFSYLIKKLF